MNTNSNKCSEFYSSCLEEIRDYASYFALSRNQSQNELEVVHIWNKSLKNNGKEPFSCIQIRDQGNDPPDCEATDGLGRRIGIEVTELVDQYLANPKNKGDRGTSLCAKPEAVLKVIDSQIRRKDTAQIKDGPYAQYILIIYSDDPHYVEHGNLKEVRSYQFGETKLIDHAYLLLSYCPFNKCCPLIELNLCRISEAP